MNEQTAQEREQAVLLAHKIRIQLFKLTTMALEYRLAEAKHNREMNVESWRHREAVGKMYEQESQWFYDRNLLPQWSENERCFIKATPTPENANKGEVSNG